MTRESRSILAATLFVAAGLFQISPAAGGERFELQPGDHVAYIGNTLADRMQHHAWLETYIHAMNPKHNLTFRNLAFPGDEVKTRVRSENFGSPDQWLTKVQADVVFCFFGYNEALRGEAGLESFRKELAETLDGMLAQQYQGESAPRIVVFSPIAHENLHSPHLPDGSANNKNLALYTSAMRDVCREKDVRFVDLFAASKRLYKEADEPLTINGIHLTNQGNRALADVIVRQLFDKDPIENTSEGELLETREAVLDKNLYWFSRYRVVDGYNVYGGRSKLEWFGQSNADVMKREMEIFDRMTANRDKRVWAVARGDDYVVVDDNLPPLLEVKTNNPGTLEGGRHPYLGAKEAIGKMRLAEGMQVNLFASEEMFPEMVNPVQMAVDTDGRLFVSVWPSYPHWNPTQPRTDRIICLPDEDGDGVADKCVVFADELNSVTSFEFWGGGMLVAAPPEIWFLKDSDGDDRADVKIRMLQGVSSADSHHTANGMLIGPDGWLYWSRGIFNVASMETPTKTYRSGNSGVHRFNPRTFEMEFHFPIGPNPHGDAFDQWGYQFANDGTSGTGSYVDIGKGIGNKQWFEKRVRPVAATGILSSSHFPEKNQGNFLICNTIGFLGVLQHEVKYDGADITAVEIEPILVSSDPNFRPTDLEIAGDGALYVSDWSNALIGHMQHNIRDPNRDHSHGRIYRVTCKDRPLLEPVKLKGKPIETVLDAFFTKEKGTRYRARLELSGRETDDVMAVIGDWTAKLDPAKPADAQALLECLWVHEEHRVPNLELVKTTFRAEEPRVRAAAIRTLGHWTSRVSDWESTLLAAARDESALVRAEAVKSAVNFGGPTAAEVVFEVAVRPTDAELEYVLKYAREQINLDQLVHNAITSGRPLSSATREYALQYGLVEDLLRMGGGVDVYEAILERDGVDVSHLRTALVELAKARDVELTDLLLDLIAERDKAGQGDKLYGLGVLLSEQPSKALREAGNRIEQLAATGRTAQTRRLAYAAWITADGSGDAAFFTASKDRQSLRDLLEAVPAISDDHLRGELYADARSLVFELPPNLKSESTATAADQQGITVDYFQPNPTDVALDTLAKLTPKASGIVPDIAADVPLLKRKDRYALRFTGTLQVPKSGRYTFYTASDDGSRFYIGDSLVVDNDGLHGMREKSGARNLSAGAHPISVTYFDNGGGDGLVVSWSGPGIDKQKIPADKLAVGDGETLHDVAIRALVSIPGHEEEKFADMAALIKSGKHRGSAIRVLRAIPEQHWPTTGIRELIDNVIGYLSEIPADYRTGDAASAAVELAKSLAARLPTEEADAVLNRLENLDVRVIAIGTVPHRMIYDKEQIVIQAGKPVEFRFTNSDDMPHNLSITKPGALEEVGLLAEATARDPDAIARQYVPESDQILLASQLLQPGENQAITFEAPETPGVYPYVCTYPGHWRRMYGALYVVEDLEDYRTDPEGYLAEHPLPLVDELLKYIGRNTEWTFDDLAASVTPLSHGRSFEVGKNIFRVANCVGCHKINGEGQELGPDLTKLDPKKHKSDYILRSLLEPSKDIEEKFQSYTFALDSGKIVTGMIVEETATEVKVLIDPLAKRDPIVIQKSEIDTQEKSPNSIMPTGLANKLTSEEILDLIAYIYARGDEKHELFETQHEH